MGLLGKCLLSIEKLESFSYFNIYHKLLLLKCANSFFKWSSPHQKQLSTTLAEVLHTYRLPP